MVTVERHQRHDVLHSKIFTLSSVLCSHLQVYIFQMAGLSGNFSLIAACIQYIINVVMTVPALVFMDKWPRRKVMMAGSFVMAVWLFTEAGLMASYGHGTGPEGLNGISSVTWVVDDSSASKAIIACSYLFIATFAVTWGPVGW
jgi:hypothetical protein